MRLAAIRWTIIDIAAMMRCAQWLRDCGVTVVPEHDGDVTVWRVK